MVSRAWCHVPGGHVPGAVCLARRHLSAGARHMALRHDEPGAAARGAGHLALK